MPALKRRWTAILATTSQHYCNTWLCTLVLLCTAVNAMMSIRHKLKKKIGPMFRGIFVENKTHVGGVFVKSNPLEWHIPVCLNMWIPLMQLSVMWNPGLQLKPSEGIIWSAFTFKLSEILHTEGLFTNTFKGGLMQKDFITKSFCPPAPPKISEPLFCHENYRSYIEKHVNSIFTGKFVIFFKAPPLTRVKNFKGPLFASGSPCEQFLQ